MKFARFAPIAVLFAGLAAGCATQDGGKRSMTCGPETGPHGPAMEAQIDDAEKNFEPAMSYTDDGGVVRFDIRQKKGGSDSAVIARFEDGQTCVGTLHPAP